MSESNVDLWPGFRLIWRDKDNGWEIPLTVVLDAPLSFELPFDEALSEEQFAEIFTLASKQECASIGVTETFGAVMKLIRDQLGVIPSCEEKDQHRLGRMLAIASVFDDGVAVWCDHWQSVLSHSKDHLAKQGKGAFNSSSVLQRRVDSLHEMVSELLENVDVLVEKESESELKTTIADLERRPFLALKEVCTRIGRYPKWFYDHDLLNDLGKSGGTKDLKKLNGMKVGKNARAPWKFEKGEVERFIADVFRPMWEAIVPEGNGPGVSIRAPRA